MPRLKPAEVAEAMRPSRTPKQLANDARLRSKRRVAISSDDLTGGRSQIDISATGPLKVDRSTIEVIPESKGQKKAADEAFMNQIVTVQINGSEDPDEPVWVPSGHNGDMQYFQRGIPQQIKLRFLHSLIAAKKTALTSSFGKDGSGKEFNKLIGRTSTTHRFDVIEASPEARKAITVWMQQPA